MLAETLIVTTFVSGILIFLFIQFNNLSSAYNESYKYNTVEGLYSLRNIRDYVYNEPDIYYEIDDVVDFNEILDITDCEKNRAFELEYCKLLFELEDIKTLIVATNSFNLENFENRDEELKMFVGKIKPTGDEKYRLIAEFNDGTFATIRMGS